MTQEQNMTKTSTYTADNITVLEGLSAVRMRPAMYIGSTNTNGLHHLVYEVIDNSIDEAMAGYCDHIKVTVHMDNSVRQRREERGLSQAALGEQLGVSRQTVNSIETGKYDPSLPLAFAIARFFGTAIEEIFHD